MSPVPPTPYLYYLAVLQAYLLGAVPFGFLLARYWAGIDVRKVGSGNIGATNVARMAGARLGLVAFFLDLAKGFAGATVIPFSFYVFTHGYTAETAMDVVRGILYGGGFGGLRVACGFAAIAGHVWTVFLRFKGGKGVATSLGVMLGLTPAPTLIAFGVWIVLTAISGYISLGSIVAALVLPAAFVFIERKDLAGQKWLLAAVIMVALIVVWRHRGNIRRLIAGTESSFYSRRNKSAPPEA